MSTGNSGLFQGPAGALADEADAPIGFDETPPEESGSAFPCRDHAPRTICPALTNGGAIRAMDNHQLAAWLAQQHKNTANRDAWSEDEYFRWLGNPAVAVNGDAEAIPPNASDEPENALRRVPTCELVAELRTREGVETTAFAPYCEGTVCVSGPAIVLNVTD